MSLARDRYGFDVRVLDISPVAVGMARQRGITADTFDITNALPFNDGSFGSVVALNVLEHVYDPLSLLREMGRVGSSVVVAVPNFHFIVGRISMVFGRIPFQSKPRRGHVYWFNYYVLSRMVRDAGMRIERITYGPIARLGVFGRILARLLPNLFADSFVVLLVRHDEKPVSLK